MTDRSRLVFDGHNDLVLHILRGSVTPEDVARGYARGHIDLPRAQEGGFAGGFFALFVPSPGDRDAQVEAMTRPPYDLPLPGQVGEEEAAAWCDRGFDALDALEEAGAVTLCRSADAVETALQEERMAAVAHMEGAEAIDRDFARLHAYHARGLRSLGPVWSRDTIWGHGVPFRFPSTPDTGPGLTGAGRALVAECNTLGIVVDLAHITQAGFEDVARISEAPLVASHSNAWAVTPHARNLTDRQLDMIRDSDGIVGINFASAFLRPDGKMDADLTLDVVLRHFDHLIDRLGETRIGLGSDFDGALVPAPIGDCAGLPALLEALSSHGVDPPLMAKFCHENWLRVLRLTERSGGEAGPHRKSRELET